MTKFIKVTGYKGERVLVNVATIESVNDFKSVKHDEELPEMYKNAGALIHSNDGVLVVNDDYESLRRRLLD